MYNLQDHNMEERKHGTGEVLVSDVNQTFVYWLYDWFVAWGTEGVRPLRNFKCSADEDLDYTTSDSLSCRAERLRRLRPLLVYTDPTGNDNSNHMDCFFCWQTGSEGEWVSGVSSKGAVPVYVRMNWGPELWMLELVPELTGNPSKPALPKHLGDKGRKRQRHRGKHFTECYENHRLWRGQD